MSTDNKEVLPAEENLAGETKPTPSIKPTVGRMVYYKTDNGGILPATIVVIHTDTCINLQVFTDDEKGIMYKTSVVQGEENGQWDWMPFQKDQQARLAKEEVLVGVAKNTVERGIS